MQELKVLASVMVDVDVEPDGSAMLVFVIQGGVERVAITLPKTAFERLASRISQLQTLPNTPSGDQ